MTTFASRVFSTYIMGSLSGVLYTGMTNNLRRRVWEHKYGPGESFAHRYRARRLLYCEHFPTPMAAIRRENQIKKMTRAQKKALIASLNPQWNDLASSWYPNGVAGGTHHVPPEE